MINDELYELWIQASIALGTAEDDLIRAARRGDTDLHDLGLRVWECFLVEKRRWAALDD